jgi:S1-C subfamily serine protease
MAEGIKWHRKAAEQGNAAAQAAVGVSYLLGIGLNPNPDEAARWLRKAAEQDEAAAQYLLGNCYTSGHGVVSNLVEAVKWYRKAANQGVPAAQCALGRYYNSVKDTTEGVRWFRRAAEQGCADAQPFVGLAYGVGIGVSQNLVEGYKWFSIASINGKEEATELMRGIAGMMTPEQISEAQDLARRFKPRDVPKPSVFVSLDSILRSSPESSATGFWISSDGFLVTNEHVVRDATQVRLVTSAGLISAKVVKVDAANDLALLKADGKFSPLPVASSRTIRSGNTVATVGFPNIGLQGFAPKLAKGEIASLSGAGDDARYFQISVPVQPGNSGGALLDERGNVVGVVSAKLSARAAFAATGSLPENVNYAVKSSFLLGFLESVPEVSAKLKEPNTKEQKFEDVVRSAQQAAVLVLVY